MKKIIKFFFCIIVSLLMISCDNNTNKLLLRGNLNNHTTIPIDQITLKNKINNQESFVLSIYLETCEACISFNKEILDSYIEKTKMDIYSVNLIDLENYENYENKPYATEAPQIFIYDKGKEIAHLKYEYGKKEFENFTNFTNYMNQYIMEPKLITISEELLDQKIFSKEDFLLYIGWNQCGDCKLLDTHLLNDYLKENYKIDNVIYYLESENYINDPTKWKEFTKKYQFDSFRSGRVPTLQFYQKGVIQEMIVYHNDVIENNIVKESFFEDCLNKNLTDEQLLEIHDQKMYEFLDKYYKK